jgi:hypothetical protein
MSEMKSYFHTARKPISFINICDIKPHRAYVSPVDDDAHFISKMNRSAYSSEVNEWLNYPFINSEYWWKLDREEWEREREEHYLYGEENEDLKYTDDWSNDLVPDNYHDCEPDDDCEPDEELPKVKDICKTMYDELLYAINNAGFQINDLNQFKEDFIHYMYTLSENQEPET